MDLSIVIVNWNTKDLLDQCLSSIFKFSAKNKNYEVIVIDNGSKDKSRELLKIKYPQVKTILNKSNLGFSKANNQGIQQATGDYCLLLNSDTYFIEDSMTKLIRFAKSKYNLGAVGPLLLNQDQSIQQSVGFFPNLWQLFFWSAFIDDLPFGHMLKPYHVDHSTFYKNDHEIDWATGAAFLFPKSIINKVGLLDEKIFMYGEEVEWSYRIKKAGYKIYFTPMTKIVHIKLGSSKKISRNAFLGEYQGIIYFYKKHKGKLSLQIARLFLKMGALLRILAFSLLARKELAKIYVEAFKVA